MNKFSLLVVVLCSEILSVGAQTNTFPSNGNVGIGTTSPITNFEVVGTAVISNPAGTNYNENLRLPSSATGYACIALGASAGGAGTGLGQWSLVKFPSVEASRFSIRHNNDDYLNISTNGNIGMGISNPVDRLAVNGRIKAKEIKVELTGWPDVVFAKDYVLPTLQETEKHIFEKGHLPGIPSAAEVEKNGVELGDMNKTLLQKIEELTLYLIEQGKDIKELKKQNKNLLLEIEKIKQ
jgi:hypothetical protein